MASNGSQARLSPPLRDRARGGPGNLSTPGAPSPGIPPEQTLLLGFSQGACLALEFAARHARRFGGVVGLSGGLIGPPGTPRDYPGSLAGTPGFLGCSDPDPHISKERVVESAETLQRLGADVTMRLYPNLGHTINEDELDIVRSIMDKMVAS
jgi:phospholipase/carboxylesterase